MYKTYTYSSFRSHDMIYVLCSLLRRLNDRKRATQYRVLLQESKVTKKNMNTSLKV